MTYLRLLLLVAICVLPGCQLTAWNASPQDDAKLAEAELNIGPVGPPASVETASTESTPLVSDAMQAASGSREGSTFPATANDLPLGQSDGDAPLYQAATFNNPAANNPEAPRAADRAFPPVGSDDAVLRELQAIGAADPQAAQELIEKLQSVPPSLRALTAEQFRTTWQFRQELKSRTMRSKAGELPNYPLSHQPGHSITEKAMEQLQQKLLGPINLHPPRLPLSTDALSPQATLYEKPRQSVSPVRSRAVEGKLVVNLSEAKARESSLPVTPISYDQQPRPLPPVASRSAAEATWQVALEEATASLTAATSNDPHNTQEAYQHARLRLLQLVAGNKGAALEPIPGLTPTEQSYWSNQLFALSTLLDHDAQADDEKRAALAGSQLADAVTQLSELSALSVRNLTFCKKVYGYGDYEILKESNGKTVFKPGQAVTLYAEMDNFRSESTEKGYHTSLATSYEVLDQNGHRVEGGEFATVDDYCQRHRHDFYIEYTFELPKRIYPSGYQIRLMIRDRLSGKIGKATVDFEIEE